MTRDCANITRPPLHKRKTHSFWGRACSSRNKRTPPHSGRPMVAPTNNKRTPPHTPSIGHPERTQYAKLFAVEACRAAKSRAACGEEISKRLPIAFLGQMIRSEYTNDTVGRGFVRTYCAARSDHVKTWSPFGLRGLSVYCITNFFTAVSESTLRMTAGEVFRWALVADDQTRKRGRPYK